MMDLHTKDDKEMIVKSNLQSTAVVELDQILGVRGLKMPSWVIVPYGTISPKLERVLTVQIADLPNYTKKAFQNYRFL